MKLAKLNLALTSALALAAVLALNPAAAQDKPKPADKPKGDAAPDQAEMMKKYEAAIAPGPAHKVLEAVVGEWNLETKFWMGGSDNPPMESKGTSKVRWILGGRFVQEEVDGQMMNMPFQGMGLTGYDNMKKKYVGVWVDNMGTAISTSEGDADADGKVITTTGKMDDPMSGAKDKPVKYVLRILSPNKHVLEMYDLSLGEKGKMGEITYTRK